MSDATTENPGNLNERITRTVTDADLVEDFIANNKRRTGRECGDCSMCCKLLNIDNPELVKPAGKWCQHCAPGKGCKIYPARPQTCQLFFCGWLINSGVGEEWKPSRSKIVINYDHDGNTLSCHFVVDPAFPDRWREEPYHRGIRQTAYNGLRGINGEYCRTYVKIAQRSLMVLPHKEVEVTGKAHVVIRTGEAEWKVQCFANDDELRQHSAMVRRLGLGA